LHVFTKRGEDRLERRLESEAFSRREIGVMEMSWIFYSGEPWLFPDGNFSLGPRIRTLSFLANACMIGSWPFVILFTASVIENHLLGIDLPIIQAPMAGLATSAMAAAVAEVGGLGSLGCAVLSADQIRAGAMFNTICRTERLEARNAVTRPNQETLASRVDERQNRRHS
jgi:hypothetical protein